MTAGAGAQPCAQHAKASGGRGHARASQRRSQQRPGAAAATALPRNMRNPARMRESCRSAARARSPAVPARCGGGGGGTPSAAAVLAAACALLPGPWRFQLLRSVRWLARIHSCCSRSRAPAQHAHSTRTAHAAHAGRPGSTQPHARRRRSRHRTAGAPILLPRSQPAAQGAHDSWMRRPALADKQQRQRRCARCSPGRRLGSFWKHLRRKSSMSGEMLSGSGGHSSCGRRGAGRVRSVGTGAWTAGPPPAAARPCLSQWLRAWLAGCPRTSSFSLAVAPKALPAARPARLPLPPPHPHLHEPEGRAHWLHVVVGRRPSQQLHDEAAHAPNVRRRRHLRHLNHLRGRGEGAHKGEQPPPPTQHGAAWVCSERRRRHARSGRIWCAQAQPHENRHR